MSTEQPPEISPKERLASRYVFILQSHDQAAVQWKRWHLGLGIVSLGAAWLALILAIAGLALPLSGETSVLLRWLVIGLGSLVTLGTLAQTGLLMKGRWLQHRAAAERLRKVCRLHRAGLPPFDGAKADHVFADTLAQLDAIGSNNHSRDVAGGHSWRYYLSLLWLPARLPGRDLHAPDLGVEPRLDDQPERFEREFLHERINHQRAWHLHKARGYLLRYLAFQFGIVCVAVADIIYAWQFDRPFGWIALITAVSLALHALRDFLGDGLLCQRYVKVAGNLAELADQYHQARESGGEEREAGTDAAGPNPFLRCADDRERLRRLVQYVEQVLSSEFQYWYATRH
jgi:hypothetical protein